MSFDKGLANGEAKAKIEFDVLVRGILIVVALLSLAEGLNVRMIDD
jgi:hypothetical protein